MDDLTVRRMEKKDISQILQIESDSFPAPWAEHAFSSELSNNFAVYFVLDYHKQVIGYTGMWLFSGEAHITTIAVHPDHRGAGLGKLLMKTDLNYAHEQGTELMILEVRPSNLKAIKLYKELGFRQVGVRRNYYMETKEDALVMMLRLNQAATDRRGESK